MYKAVKIKIFISTYFIMFITLVISEYQNAFYNIKYNVLGISGIGRIHFAFKPTVMIIYLIFTTITYVKVLDYLNHFLSF